MENVINHSSVAIEHPLHQADHNRTSHGPFERLGDALGGMDQDSTKILKAFGVSAAAVALDHVLFPEGNQALKEEPFSLTTVLLFARPALYLGAAYMLSILPQIVRQATTKKVD